MPAPTLFEPGVISASANDGAPTFSADGTTLLFERTNGKIAAILESHRRDDRWSQPALAPFSGIASDQQPAFSPDGSYVVFVSSRTKTTGDDQAFASHLYRVNRTAEGWGEPAELPASVNISDRVFKPSIARNGDLYFMSDTGDGGERKWRLFVARRLSNGYAPAAPLPFSGAEDGDVDPFIAPDQSYLIFSSNTRGPHDGHEHLFITRCTSSGWSAIEPLRYDGDGIGADDGEAQVNPGGTTLYFTSSRVTPMSRIRTRSQTQETLRRMESWDNSNNNVWTLPTGPLHIAAGGAGCGQDSARGDGHA